ncbi:MAG: hypothetical protein DRP35_08485 [Candidatus Zixiibacteriota bacterium]|nr:MAG: hypothetical protein DRP35_08485 [candidate division Zixibacteria bacterium]
MAVNANQIKNKNPQAKKNWEILPVKDVDSSIYVYYYINGAMILLYFFLKADKKLFGIYFKTH